ncbi:hypothetical protein, partial [Flavobacterium sp.]|uniref:hypothetical protein n=1 Tax=Flavobacterium sp. TaxID=239 RepID=UPI0038FBEDDB
NETTDIIECTNLSTPTHIIGFRCNIKYDETINKWVLSVINKLEIKERYGVENASPFQIVKDKREDTLINKL